MFARTEVKLCAEFTPTGETMPTALITSGPGDGSRVLADGREVAMVGD
jgi:hypothetical protein